jgi:hypothetical protein
VRARRRHCPIRSRPARYWPVRVIKRTGHRRENAPGAGGRGGWRSSAGTTWDTLQGRPRIRWHALGPSFESRSRAKGRGKWFSGHGLTIRLWCDDVLMSSRWIRFRPPGDDPGDALRIEIECSRDEAGGTVTRSEGNCSRSWTRTHGRSRCSSYYWRAFDCSSCPCI